MQMKINIIIFLIFTSFTTTNAQPVLIGFGTLYPADESKYDKSFSEFLTILLSAIQNRDKVFVYEIVDDNIQLNEHALTNSNENSKQGFSHKYNLDDSTNEFWLIAAKLLYLGAKKNDYGCNCFMFPSIMHSEMFAKIFGDNYYDDVYDKNINYGSTVYENVFVYKEPDVYSEIVGFLKYQIIKVNTEFEDRLFYQVYVNDNNKYYILKNNIYTCMWDYFMKFEKKNDVWKLVHFETTGL